MKNYFFLIFFISLSAYLNGQTVASTFVAGDSVINLYKNDADRLAIRRVNFIRSTYKDSVRIDPQLSKRYLDALIAVHNAIRLPANDTITRLLNIHTYNPGLNSLIVIADSNLVWMTNLRFNIYPTRDFSIDKMMAAYSLKKVFYSGLLQPSLVVFKTERNSNLAPLARKVKTFLGVTAAESDYLYGDGNDITDSISENFTDLTYSYGWQDCPSGCLLRRYWKFRVHDNASVEYRGSYGCPLEPSLLLSIQENDVLFSNVKVYANPVKSKLYVECGPAENKNIALSILNKKKELVYSVKKLKPTQEIDLILLSNGTYYLQLEGNSQQKTYKVYKQ